MNELNFYYNKNLKDFARRLRRESTQAEVKLWQEVLRGKKMHGYGFLRQRPVYNYIADFMCKKLWLIIEIDGYTHHWESKWKLDLKRQKELESLDFTVLRFTDEEVLQEIRNVERVIEQWVLDHPPAPPSKGNSKTSLNN